MADRVGRYQKQEVGKVFDRLTVIAQQPYMGFFWGPDVEKEIRFLLEQLYLAGASWGEQDAASDAAIEISDLNKEIRDLQEDQRSSGSLGYW